MTQLYKRLTCWHCGKGHFDSQSYCYHCNGCTLPTRTHSSEFDPKGQPISWEVIEIQASDSTQSKADKLDDAAKALANNQYVAILGFDRLKNMKKQKSVVFVHRPGGDKRLSHMDTKTRPTASGREWARISKHDWEAFKELVGELVIQYRLPGSLPLPQPTNA